MISSFTKFGGDAKGARNLARHLNKEQAHGARFEAINSGASSIDGIIAEARFLAAGRGVADRPYWHISLSPSDVMDPAKLRQAVDVICTEIGVTDQPVGVVYHGKDRRAGGGEMHAHLVVGRASATGALLQSGFERIRIETACRIAEFECGDRHVKGRHVASSIRHLKKVGRDDVVASMVDAFGGDLSRPTKTISPEKRQAMTRKGIDVIDDRAIVRAAWEKSDGSQSFAAALSEAGIAVERGEKRGVWIATRNGVTLGSVDRLVGEQRRAVAARLRGFEPARRDTQESGHDPDPHHSDREDVSRSEALPEGDRGLAEGPGGRGRGDGREPSTGTPGTARHDVDEQFEAPRPHGRDDRADRARRSAHVALTLSVAVHRGRERIARLIELARETIATVDRPRRRADLQPSADPDIETEAPAPARLTFEEKLAARRAAALPPPPEKSISDILAEQRKAVRTDDDSPVYRGPGYP